MNSLIKLLCILTYSLLLVGCGGSVDSAENSSTVKTELIVEAPPTFTIMLEWVAPEFRLDGAPLSLDEIVGYKVYMGNDESDMDVIAVVDNPMMNSLEIDNLPRGIHYIAISAIDENQFESPASEAVKIIF